MPILRTTVFHAQDAHGQDIARVSVWPYIDEDENTVRYQVFEDEATTPTLQSPPVPWMSTKNSRDRSAAERFASDLAAHYANARAPKPQPPAGWTHNT
jgi:hypothetical protein